MKIAYTMVGQRGGVDPLLAGVAERLAGLGCRVCGCVQVNTDRRGRRRCDMDLRLLPAGPVIRISEDRGSGARGCRLDAGALETAVALVEAAAAEGCDMLIVNKFGKHEAEGRGFRHVIAEAAGMGLPVLVGVNALNEAVFRDFTGGLAEQLAPCPATLTRWLLEAAGARSRQAEAARGAA